jgi:hypothetical protein
MPGIGVAVHRAPPSLLFDQEIIPEVARAIAALPTSLRTRIVS